MKQSIVQLGRSRAQDEELSAALDGNSQRFLILAQRLVWGVDQADLVKVNVPETAARLTSSFPSSPVAFALAAYGLRRSDRVASDAAMEQARSLAGSQHPHGYLLPTREEWAGAKPSQQIECLVPNRAWRVSSFESVSDMDLARENAATLIQTEDAGLVLVNPVPLSPETVHSIKQLGEVRSIVVQGKAHSRCLETAAKIFPNAISFATRSHRLHPPCAGLSFDRLLDEVSPSNELVVLPVLGTVLDEMTLLHKPTGLFIVQDLIHGSLRKIALPFATRIYAFAFGIEDRVGLAGYRLFMVNDLQEFQASFAEIERADAKRIVGAHFGLVEGDAMQGLAQTARWVGELSGMSHKALLLRYFPRQSGFLRDLIRYKRSQKSARRPS